MTDFAPLTLVTPQEHPFAQFVRILGKGKRGARNLTREEAREAMGMLLDEKVEDTQLGAFLMLLRFRGEDAEEITGMVQAVRDHATLGRSGLGVDLDDLGRLVGRRHRVRDLGLVGEVFLAGGLGEREALEQHHDGGGW